MEKINWSDEYSVGISYLDKQHQNIIGFINRLIETPDVHVRSATVHDVLSDMMRYSKEHLYDEERFLRDNAYPDLEEHIQFHRHYLEQLTELTVMASDSDESVPEDLLLFLRDWWLEHILKEDMKYKSFFHKS